MLPWCCLRWSVFETPWPLDDRDCTALEYADVFTTAEQGRVYCTASTSVELAACPELTKSPTKFVRLQVYPSGYVWRDLPNGDVEVQQRLSCGKEASVCL